LLSPILPIIQLLAPHFANRCNVGPRANWHYDHRELSNVLLDRDQNQYTRLHQIDLKTLKPHHEGEQLVLVENDVMLRLQVSINNLPDYRHCDNNPMINLFGKLAVQSMVIWIVLSVSESRSVMELCGSYSGLDERFDALGVSTSRNQNQQQNIGLEVSEVYASLSRSLHFRFIRNMPLTSKPDSGSFIDHNWNCSIGDQLFRLVDTNLKK
jgi:hypothetical protein